MANYSQLKAAIADVIKTNGTQAITGQVLQDVLNSMVSVIGANYTFAGVATPSTNPGTPDQNVVYMASEEGTYTNFGGIEVPTGISLLKFKGTWSIDVIINFNSSETPFVRKNIMVYSGLTQDDYRNASTNIQARGQNEVLNQMELKGVSYDYQKTASVINSSGQWVSAGTSFAVCYFFLSKGKRILFKIQNTTSSNREFAGYWVTTKPEFEVTDFTDKSVFFIQNTANGLWKYVEFTAPEDGYLVVRYHLGSGESMVSAVWENSSSIIQNIKNYVRQWMGNLPLKTGKGIDCLDGSATFGEEIDLASSTSAVGCTAFVDISDYVFLEMRLLQLQHSAIKDIQVGSMFYDSNKQPISVAVALTYTNSAYTGYYLYRVPAEAKYIRLTGIVFNCTLFPRISIYSSFSPSLS